MTDNKMSLSLILCFSVALCWWRYSGQLETCWRSDCLAVPTLIIESMK